VGATALVNGISALPLALNRALRVTNLAALYSNGNVKSIEATVFCPQENTACLCFQGFHSSVFYNERKVTTENNSLHRFGFFSLARTESPALRTPAVRLFDVVTTESDDRGSPNMLTKSTKGSRFCRPMRN
jgi:hypothetical protein